MLSSLNEIFYADMNSCIEEWEQLLANLKGVDIGAAIDDAKQEAWESIQHTRCWEDVDNVSNDYAEALGRAIDTELKNKFTGLSAFVYANCINSRLNLSSDDLPSSYTTSVVDLEDFDAFLEEVTQLADFYAILDEVQNHDEVDADADYEPDSFMAKLQSSTVEAVIDGFADDELAVQEVVDTQTFYNTQALPEQLRRAIGSALAVKTMLDEQIDAMQLEGITTEVTIESSVVKLFANFADGEQLEVSSHADLGEVLNYQ